MGYSTQSITQQIQYGKSLSITNQALRNEVLVSLGNSKYLIMNSESVISKYKSSIKRCVSKYLITGVDEIKFQFKPTYLSYTLYQTIELAPFILEVNNMKSATEFCNFKNGIYLFNANIVDVLNEILNKEEKNLQLNRDDIDAELAAIGATVTA